MRILFGTSTYPPLLNGQAVFTQNLVEGLAACGHETLVLVPKGGDIASEALKKGVQIQSAASIRAFWFYPNLRVPIALGSSIGKTFKQFQPQLIHIQDPSPLNQALIKEARRAGVPVIISHHTGSEITAPYLRFGNPLLKKLATWIAWKFIVAHLNQADLVMVPSRYSANLLADHGVKSAIQAIPCGIHLDTFQPDPQIDRAAVRQQYGLDNNKVLLLYVGRIDIEKNLETLINGIAMVKTGDIQLAIAGQGSEESSVRKLLEKLGLQARVILLGSVKRTALPDLLNSADIFVMPGCTESFSIATLEAMACAKPILAANGAALPELVTHRVNGYLYQPSQPDDVKRGIEELIAGRGNWKAMSASSLGKAQQYSLTKMLQATELTYQAWGKKS